MNKSKHSKCVHTCDFLTAISLKWTAKKSWEQIPNPDKRNIQVKFDVTAEERELIRKKMETAHINQLGAYLRKMAIDGLIVYTDMTDFKQYSKELSVIGRNINQIAKRLNSTNTIYDNDVTEIKERLNEIWQLQRRILLSLH